VEAERILKSGNQICPSKSFDVQLFTINMSSNLDQTTADEMKIPLRDRGQLTQRLVSTLDDEVASDTEALWFAEAERRLEELPSGKVRGISAEGSFRNAREALKR